MFALGVDVDDVGGSGVSLIGLSPWRNLQGQRRGRLALVTHCIARKSTTLHTTPMANAPTAQSRYQVHPQSAITRPEQKLKSPSGWWLVARTTSTSSTMAASARARRAAVLVRVCPCSLAFVGALPDNGSLSWVGALSSHGSLPESRCSPDLRLALTSRCSHVDAAGPLSFVNLARASCRPGTRWPFGGSTKWVCNSGSRP